MLLELRWNDGANIFVSIIIMLALIGLGILVFRSIKKEAKKYKEESINYIDGLLQKAELVSDVTAYISRSSAVEFSLIYIDIDKFSNVISAFGSDEANKILEKIAYTLLDNLPSRVELARIKEDKFIAFAKGEYAEDEVEEIAKRLLEAVSKPIKIYGDANINITASIGISFYPIHGLNFKELMSNAEIAVYICKRNGGNQYKIYSMENMNETANLEYYHQIKSGIKNKEFCLYYQPMIDCRNNTIYGIEGLLRWNHPVHGILSPYKFINIMEQSGDINWVGLWGLESLMKEYEVLATKFPSLKFKMSMNLSPKQLANPNITSDFQKVLKTVRIQPKNIVLEIEEFALFEKHEGIKQNVQNLNKLGFKIAVDGFSLDYVTLSKLEALPIDVIKVDNDFLDPENDTFLKDKFVDMLVDFTKTESKELVVEGIEDEKMLNKAMQMHLDNMQGYYFAKPMSDVELENYIKNESWKALIPNEEKVEVIEEKKEEIVEEVKEPVIEEEKKEETIEVVEEPVVKKTTSSTKKSSTGTKKSSTGTKKSTSSTTKKTSTGAKKTSTGAKKSTSSSTKKTTSAKK